MSTLTQFTAPVEAGSPLAGLSGEQGDLSDLWFSTER